jgi:hypothetical protein
MTFVNQKVENVTCNWMDACNGVAGAVASEDFGWFDRDANIAVYTDPFECHGTRTKINFFPDGDSSRA